MADRKRILLVDDDPDFLSALQLTLEAAGYQFLSARTAAEAIPLLRRERVDLAILDLMMEETDSGITVAYQLRRQPEMAKIPVLLVTAVASQTGFRAPLTTPEEREWLKVDAWLDKPIKPERLLEEVKRLTHG